MNKRLALIISNGDYHDPSLARLQTPERDAGRLAHILSNPALGRFDDVQVLLNEPTPTVQRAIAQFFARKKRDDLLLLYFSGHGLLDERGRLYLALQDTERELLTGSALPAAFITDEMDRSRSRRQVLILDCCHSGAFSRGAKGEIGRPVNTATAFRGSGSGRVILTASDATEYAWEGDELIGEGQNSIFTHYLVEGIETGAADTNRDGLITLDELYDYVYEQVISQAIEGQLQTPGKWAYKQQGDITLAYTCSEPDNTQYGISHPGTPGRNTSPIQNLKSKIQNHQRPYISWFWLVPLLIVMALANLRFSNASLAAAVLGKGPTSTLTPLPAIAYTIPATTPFTLATDPVPPSPTSKPASPTAKPASPTPAATIPTSTPTDEAAAVPDAATPTAEPTSTTSPTAEPTATPTGYPIRLFYNEASFYLFNGGSQRLELRSLAFEALDAAGRRTRYRFNGRQWTDFHPYVEPGSCVGIESLAGPNLQPGLCRSFNAILLLTIPLPQAEITFWLPQAGGDTFWVLWNEDEVGRCPLTQPSCRLYLPIESNPPHP